MHVVDLRAGLCELIPDVALVRRRIAAAVADILCREIATLLAGDRREAVFPEGTSLDDELPILSRVQVDEMEDGTLVLERFPERRYIRRQSRTPALCVEVA